MDENPYKAPVTRPNGVRPTNWPVLIPCAVLVLLAPLCLASLALHHVTFVQRPPLYIYIVIDGSAALLAIAGLFVATHFGQSK